MKIENTIRVELHLWNKLETQFCKVYLLPLGYIMGLVRLG